MNGDDYFVNGMPRSSFHSFDIGQKVALRAATARTIKWITRTIFELAKRSDLDFRSFFFPSLPSPFQITGGWKQLVKRTVEMHDSFLLSKCNKRMLFRISFYLFLSTIFFPSSPSRTRETKKKRKEKIKWKFRNERKRNSLRKLFSMTALSFPLFSSPTFTIL